jgi:hypothetical protein
VVGWLQQGVGLKTKRRKGGGGGEKKKEKREKDTKANYM